MYRGQHKIEKSTRLGAVERSCVRAVTSWTREQQQQQQQQQRRILRVTWHFLSFVSFGDCLEVCALMMENKPEYVCWWLAMVGVPRQLPRWLTKKFPWTPRIQAVSPRGSPAVKQRLEPNIDVLEDVFPFQIGGVSGFRWFRPFVFRGVWGFFFLKNDDFCAETRWQISERSGNLFLAFFSSAVYHP